MYSSYMVLTFLVVVLTISGCGVSLFVKPEEQPVVDELIFLDWPDIPGFSKGGIRALSTKIERRLVLFRRDPSDRGKLTVCAEPSAEATQALSSISELETALKELGISGTGSFGLTATAEAAFRRSQGLQFYRDGAYQLCQAYLNKLIGKETFVSRLQALEKHAQELIKIEIEQAGFYRTQSASPSPLPSTSSTTQATTQKTTSTTTSTTQKSSTP